jgi:hypothetical protein
MTTIQISVEVSDEVIDQVIDSAGYYIDYWATKGQQDTEAKTYKVWLDEEAREERGEKSVTLTYADLALAGEKLLTGRVKVRSDIREALSAGFIAGDAGSIDGEVADVVVQVAIFGDIIFG